MKVLDSKHVLALALLGSCGGAPRATEISASGSDGGTQADASSGTNPDSGGTTTGGNVDGTSAGGDASESTAGANMFDVGSPSRPDRCVVADGIDAVVPCQDKAPPEAFDAEVQWAWTGPGGERNSVVTPLVANLTDDNGDGNIDLCDVPDVVVVAYGCDDVGICVANTGHIYVLDGGTGDLHFRIETPVSASKTPAIGDLDGDGTVEIVSAADGVLVAFDHDGDVHWISPDEDVISGRGAIALADLDLDGDVEVIDGRGIFDHRGILVALPGGGAGLSVAPTSADLDGDGDHEVILSHSVIHDGTPYFDVPDASGFGQVANLDDDPEPEVLFTSYEGLLIVDHDGTVGPMIAPIPETEYNRPLTIHDLDGDDQVEIAVKTATRYGALETNGELMWSTEVQEFSYGAGGTAFDFLGDGSAEAIYADERTLFAFNETGDAVFSLPRSSYTDMEYPVVADVDNDGAAEIVVVSNQNQIGEEPLATVQVIRDREDRWIPARRIWNQHTYHVTNVREDGTIPSPEPHHWELLNTYRTQAQVQSRGGGVCDPAG